jgi:hypothetical protein
MMTPQIRLLIQSGLTKDVLVALAREYFLLERTFDTKHINEQFVASVKAANDRVTEILNLTDEEVAQRTEDYNNEIAPVQVEKVDGVDDVAERIYEWSTDNEELLCLKDFAIGVLEDFAFNQEVSNPLKPLEPAEWRAKMLSDAMECAKEQERRLANEVDTVKAINDAVVELKNADI